MQPRNTAAQYIRQPCQRERSPFHTSFSPKEKGGRGDQSLFVMAGLDHCRGRVVGLQSSVQGGVKGEKRKPILCVCVFADCTGDREEGEKTFSFFVNSIVVIAWEKEGGGGGGWPCVFTSHVRTSAPEGEAVALVFA